MRGVRCLVTGASGFIGGHLITLLEREGAEVIGLSRGAWPLGAAVARWHSVELADAAAVDAVIGSERPEVIVHLASLVSGQRDLDLVVPALQANLASTVHVLAAASRAGCRRVVLAGSMEEPSLGTPPPSPYAAAKAAASLYAAFFRQTYATPIVTARIFMVYGPGQRDRSKVLPASILSALAGQAPRISSGARPVDWIYVEDVARGLLALATAAGLEGETVDLGSGELVTVREVVERICSATGAPRPEVGALPDRANEAVRSADLERSWSLAGWRPEVPLDEGLARTIVHYRALAARAK